MKSPSKKIRNKLVSIKDNLSSRIIHHHQKQKQSSSVKIQLHDTNTSSDTSLSYFIGILTVTVLLLAAMFLAWKKSLSRERKIERITTTRKKMKTVAITKPTTNEQQTLSIDTNNITTTVASSTASSSSLSTSSKNKNNNKVVVSCSPLSSQQQRKTASISAAGNTNTIMPGIPSTVATRKYEKKTHVNTDDENDDDTSSIATSKTTVSSLSSTISDITTTCNERILYGKENGGQGCILCSSNSNDSVVGRWISNIFSQKRKGNQDLLEVFDEDDNDEEEEEGQNKGLLPLKTFAVNDDTVATTSNYSSSSSSGDKNNANTNHRIRGRSNSSSGVIVSTESHEVIYNNEMDNESSKENEIRTRGVDDEDGGLDNDLLLLLQQQVPASTKEECQRFLRHYCTYDNALNQLQSYINWRKEYQIMKEEILMIDSDNFESSNSSNNSLDDKDKNDWYMASNIAMYAHNKKNMDESSPSSSLMPTKTLPRFIRMYQSNEHQQKEQYVCDNDGCRILHATPGQIDPTVADAKTYALAVSLYVNSKLSSLSLEEITFCFDIRGGVGWPNIRPLNQLLYIKEIAVALLSMFPQRLNKFILYPIPNNGLWIWNIIKRMIDYAVSNSSFTSKVIILTIPTTPRIITPPPNDQMVQYVNPDIAQMLEMKRKELFIH